MKKLVVAGLMALHPSIAAGAVDPTIENGNFAFTKPYLMSVSYARSADDNALFALAISTKGQVKDQNGLDITTAISVNCKTAIFTGALGFEVEKALETAQLIAGSFCFMHKQHWSHSFW